MSSLATTKSSLLQNLPNFPRCLALKITKALEDNFSEFRQTNQYAEALSSIPSTVDQYLAHKMQEATIDDGMKKIIKEQVKKEVSKIIPKVEKFVTDQLESEVLVRSSKEANTSHAVAVKIYPGSSETCVQDDKPKKRINIPSDCFKTYEPYLTLDHAKGNKRAVSLSVRVNCQPGLAIRHNNPRESLIDFSAFAKR
ncbi:hypothetical protein Tco_0734404 [Tanacetum coccineum]